MPRITESDLLEIEKAWDEDGSFDAAYWVPDMIEAIRRLHKLEKLQYDWTPTVVKI